MNQGTHHESIQRNESNNACALVCAKQFTSMLVLFFPGVSWKIGGQVDFSTETDELTSAEI